MAVEEEEWGGAEDRPRMAVEEEEWGRGGGPAQDGGQEESNLQDTPSPPELKLCLSNNSFVLNSNINLVTFTVFYTI